ncbi:hypothetical protein LBMAG53_00130 [Planctomycetota bacterium]|nr:hypothetical protein LBMAG53_00130 [Planctomycetota bacterium]
MATPVFLIGEAVSRNHADPFMVNRSLSCCAVVLAILLVIGQSAGLQLMAWTGMVISRANTQGLSHAMATTFDGRHPCGVCVLAEALRTKNLVVQDGKPGKPDQKNTVKVQLAMPAVWDGESVGAGAMCRVAFWPARTWTEQSRPIPDPPPPKAA